MRRLRAATGLLLAALLPSTAPDVGVAAEPTKAQQLRAKYSAKDWAEIQAAAKEIHSDRRWPKDQRETYLKACEKTKAKEPSINRRTCECMLEVMMEKYETLGDHAKERMNGGGQPDDEMKTLFGICLAVYGT